MYASSAFFEYCTSSCEIVVRLLPRQAFTILLRFNDLSRVYLNIVMTLLESNTQMY